MNTATNSKYVERPKERKAKNHLERMGKLDRLTKRKIKGKFTSHQDSSVPSQQNTPTIIK